jgi:hypothetical protein
MVAPRGLGYRSAAVPLSFASQKCTMLMRVTMNNIRQPAEPKPELVECAIVELLEIAQRQGITPADFIQLLDSGMRISDFLAAMTPLANANDNIDSYS